MDSGQVVVVALQIALDLKTSEILTSWLEKNDQFNSLFIIPSPEAMILTPALNTTQQTNNYPVCLE